MKLNFTIIGNEWEENVAGDLIAIWYKTFINMDQLMKFTNFRYIFFFIQSQKAQQNFLVFTFAIEKKHRPNSYVVI